MPSSKTQNNCKYERENIRDHGGVVDGFIIWPPMPAISLVYQKGWHITFG